LELSCSPEPLLGNAIARFLQISAYHLCRAKVLNIQQHSDSKHRDLQIFHYQQDQQLMMLEILSSGLKGDV
jgi:hypothetical protein